MNPMIPLGIFFAGQLFYALSFFSGFPLIDGCKQYWDKECTPHETWMIDWFSYGITWTLLPLAVLMLNNKDNAEQLSRLSIYVTYMLVGQMAHLIHTGPKKNGGLLVDSEHLISMTVNLVFMLLFSAVSRVHQPSKSTGNPMKPDGIGRIAVLLNTLAMIFWTFDVSTLSTPDKYMQNFEANNTVYLMDANKWLIQMIVQSIFLNFYVMGYGTKKDVKTYCLCLAVINGMTEVFARYHNTGIFQEAALDEGSILRAVLVTVSLAGFVMESSVSAEAAKANKGKGTPPRAKKTK